jgi:hypothetical protein
MFIITVVNYFTKFQYITLLLLLLLLFYSILRYEFDQNILDFAIIIIPLILIRSRYFVLVIKCDITEFIFLYFLIWSLDFVIQYLISFIFLFH